MQTKFKVQFTRVGEGIIDFTKTKITKEEFHKLSWSEQETFLQKNIENVDLKELQDWIIVENINLIEKIPKNY